MRALTALSRRLAYEAASLALQSSEALEQERPGWVGLSVKMMGDAPTVSLAKVTDPAGNVLFISRGEADETALEPAELAQIPLMKRNAPNCFTLAGNRWECASPSTPRIHFAALRGSHSTNAGCTNNWIQFCAAP